MIYGINKGYYNVDNRLKCFTDFIYKIFYNYDK